jgi:hypothetical protein
MFEAATPTLNSRVIRLLPPWRSGNSKSSKLASGYGVESRAAGFWDGGSGFPAEYNAYGLRFLGIVPAILSCQSRKF